MNAVPHAINCEWIWVCPLCESPVVEIERRWYWSCECHKPEDDLPFAYFDMEAADEAELLRGYMFGDIIY